MKKAIINPMFYLNTECPICGEDIDILDNTDNDMDGQLLTPLTNNKWDEMEGIVVTCPECNKDFEIEKVEY